MMTPDVPASTTGNSTNSGEAGPDQARKRIVLGRLGRVARHTMNRLCAEPVNAASVWRPGRPSPQTGGRNRQVAEFMPCLGPLSDSRIELVAFRNKWSRDFLGTVAKRTVRTPEAARDDASTTMKRAAYQNLPILDTGA